LAALDRAGQPSPRVNELVENFIQRERPMKTRYAVTLAMVAGIGLGAAAVQGLHAQSKQVYLVTEIDVSNPDAYVKEYAPLAQASIKKAGGKLLAASLNVTAVEGTAPKRVAIQVWDSMEQVEAWRNGADYKEARKIGDKYATFRSFAVPAAGQ
jgi:uncharacterized protein (DUF1330 family)